MLKLYNTLSKKEEEIQTTEHINLYTCGPTVYNYAHIGNLRAYIMADVLYRSLKYAGYYPKWVMNITDIDDKTIKGTVAKYGDSATVENLREYTKFYLDEFLKDLDEVNVLKDEITFIRVTDVIPQIQEFIVELISKGYAYKAEDGSTYFSIEKYQKDFGDYGALVGEKFIEGKKVGARVAVDEYEKDNLSDFALWKAWDEKSDAQIYWDHATLGKGRPGWHIECSVINKIGFAGEPTDIHTGGVDLIFPHHTNEIAQSQPFYKPFSKYWFHSEHLLVEDKKMAKSAGNFFTLKDLEEKVPLAGLALRYLFLQSGYRFRQNFTQESFVASYKALEKLYNTLSSHKIIGENQELQQNILDSLIKPLEAIQNDLNAPAVVAGVWEALSSKQANIHTQDEAINELDKVLGFKLSNPPSILENVTIPDSVQQLVDARAKAREEKNFQKSDELRKQIEDLGYEVMDGKDGQKVKKKI